MAFSLDIKAAHKRIVLHEEEQGLVGFTGWISPSHISQIDLVGAHWTAVRGR